MDPSNDVRTLVLVGRTGNGKSATGNSILGKKAFKSMSSFRGVTKTTQLESTVLEDGLRLNVIDTPGLFDPSAGAGFISNEIVKCIRMAEDGIHAFLLVLSVRNRFSNEEKTAFNTLKELFGDRVCDYAIVVFTNGDDLEDDETLDSYLDRNSTDSLKAVLQMCGNRRVLFNNKTRDGYEKFEQLRQLLLLVNDVVGQNDGQPYTNELFVQFKTNSKRLDQQRDEVRAVREESEKKIWELDEKIAGINEARGTMNKQMDELHAVIEESKKKIRELDEKIAGIDETPGIMNKQMDELRAVIEESKKKISELDEKIARINEESKKKMRELDEKIAGINETRGTMNKQMDELRAVTEESKKKIRELDEKIAGINETRGTTYKQMDEPRAVIEESKKKIRKSDEKIKDIKEKDTKKENSKGRCSVM